MRSNWGLFGWRITNCRNKLGKLRLARSYWRRDHYKSWFTTTFPEDSTFTSLWNLIECWQSALNKGKWLCPSVSLFWNFHARDKRVKKSRKCNIPLCNQLSKTVCLVAVRPHLDEDPFEWIASDCSAISSWIAFKSALTGISALNPLSSFIALQSYQSIWCKQWIEREHDFVINLAYAERLTLWIKPTKCWLQLPLFQAVFRFAVIFLKLFIFN